MKTFNERRTLDRIALKELPVEEFKLFEIKSNILKVSDKIMNYEKYEEKNQSEKNEKKTMNFEKVSNYSFKIDEDDDFNDFFTKKVLIPTSSIINQKPNAENQKKIKN